MSRAVTMVDGESLDFELMTELQRGIVQSMVGPRVDVALVNVSKCGSAHDLLASEICVLIASHRFPFTTAVTEWRSSLQDAAIACLGEMDVRFGDLHAPRPTHPDATTIREALPYLKYSTDDTEIGACFSRNVFRESVMEITTIFACAASAIIAELTKPRAKSVERAELLEETNRTLSRARSATSSDSGEFDSDVFQRRIQHLKELMRAIPTNKGTVEAILSTIQHAETAAFPHASLADNAMKECDLGEMAIGLLLSLTLGSKKA